MTDQDLVKQLVTKGLLDSQVGDKIIEESRVSQTPVEEVIYKKRIIDDIQVAKVKSELLKVPYKKIDATSIPQELLNLIPFETSQTYRLAPIEKRDSLLVIGMMNPFDLRAQEALRFIAKREGLSLGVYLTTPSDLSEVWRRYSPYQNEIESAVKELNIKDSDEIDRVALEEGAKSAEDAPIIKIVASTLKQSVQLGASDIHIEPQRSHLRIRFRVNGDLYEAASLPGSLSQPVISRVKVLARLRLDEQRIPQDGRFRAIISDRDIDFRVSTFPTPSGEKVAIRVLDPKTGLRGLKEIGFSEHNLKLLTDALAEPFGMILISGPTGSGKSTSLYAMMQQLNKDDVNIVSLEDPVEYFMEGINQSQVKPEIGYDFASGLRQILRQDPDVIMVGEIRDKETASLAVNAALTGHRMLSTIHTNNALGVVPRLIDLGVPPFLLPPALRIMLSQRLILRLCDECRMEEVASPEFQKIISEELALLPESQDMSKSFSKPYSVFRSEPKADCKVCSGKGVTGRIAISEVFRMTPDLSQVISSGFTEAKLLSEAKKQGMVSLRQDGILKALQGLVSIEEVLNETSEN